MGQEGWGPDIWVLWIKLPFDIRIICRDWLITPYGGGKKSQWQQPFPFCKKCQWIQNCLKTNLFRHRKIKPINFILMPSLPLQMH